MMMHQLESILMLQYYMMPQYLGVWSKLMMPTPGPPPSSFFITSTVITLVCGFSLALVYYYIRDMLPKSPNQRIVMFADLTIGMQFVFFTLPAFLLFHLPVALLVSWFVMNFIILLANSFYCVKIIK